MGVPNSTTPTATTHDKSRGASPSSGARTISIKWWAGLTYANMTESPSALMGYMIGVANIKICVPVVTIWRTS